MNQQVLLIVVLAIVAVATTVQAVALVTALRALRRLEGRVLEAERELRALGPRLERLGHVIDHLADWTDSAAEQLPRLAAGVGGTLGLLSRPFGTALALWKGLKAGARVYRQLPSSRDPAA